jgi:hypothetical protein
MEVVTVITAALAFAGGKAAKPIIGESVKNPPRVAAARSVPNRISESLASAAGLGGIDPSI